MEGLIIWGLLLVSVLLNYFVQTHPTLSWKCIFGNHKYHYMGKRSGMTFTKDEGIKGTMREVYECRCGMPKPIENKDYV